MTAQKFEPVDRMQASLAAYTQKHGGDASGQDAFCVLLNAGGKMGKTFIQGEDGKITKQSAGQPAVMAAWQVAVPNLAAMADILAIITDNPSAAFALGRYDGAPIPEATPGLSDVFTVMSTNYAKKHNLPTDAWCDMDNGRRAICRLKDNMEPSSWLLLDRDTDPDQPKELLHDTAEAWWADMSAIAPALATTGRVELPSSSTRLLDGTGKPVFGSSNAHYFVQMEDASMLTGLPA